MEEEPVFVQHVLPACGKGAKARLVGPAGASLVGAAPGAAPAGQGCASPGTARLLRGSGDPSALRELIASPRCCGTRLVQVAQFAAAGWDQLGMQGELREGAQMGGCERWRSRVREARREPGAEGEKRNFPAVGL